MRLLKYTAAVLAAALFLGVAASASAQMTYGVLDMNKVLQTADAAKALPNRKSLNRKKNFRKMISKRSVKNSKLRLLLPKKQFRTKSRFSTRHLLTPWQSCVWKS